MGLSPSLNLTVHVRPRAGRTAILGRRADLSLDVALRAAPQGGKANAELLALLAHALSVPLTAVTIRRGKSARTKVVGVEGVGRARLDELGAGGTLPG